MVSCAPSGDEGPTVHSNIRKKIKINYQKQSGLPPDNNRGRFSNIICDIRIMEKTIPIGESSEYCNGNPLECKYFVVQTSIKWEVLAK
jgi:hypothetical protein